MNLTSSLSINDHIIATPWLATPKKHILTAFLYPKMFPPEQLHLLAFKASTSVGRSDAGEGLVLSGYSGDWNGMCRCGMTFVLGK